MRCIYLLLTIITLFSCNPELDRSNIDSIVNYTKKHIKDKDYQSLLNLTTYEREDELGKIIMETTPSVFNEEKFIYENLQLISDSIKVSNHYVDGKREEFKTIIIYFKLNQDIYRFNGVLEKIGLEYFYNSLFTKNLTASCIESKNTRNTPANVYLNEAYWLVSNDRKSFKEFNLRGRNKSDYLINQITFRLNIRRVDKSEFFSKTLTINQTILPGDSFEVKVRELDNYFTGFLLSKDTFSFNTELVEVLPKKENESCQILNTLK